MNSIIMHSSTTQGLLCYNLLLTISFDGREYLGGGGKLGLSLWFAKRVRCKEPIQVMPDTFVSADGLHRIESWYLLLILTSIIGLYSSSYTVPGIVSSVLS